MYVYGYELMAKQRSDGVWREEEEVEGVSE